MYNVTDAIAIENAKLIFRNFSGKPSKFNANGNRNFCVVLDNDIALNMQNDGWNVKWPKPGSDENLKPYIQVAISFENIVPKIWVVTSTGKTQLNEDTVGTLDWADIENVDLIIRPYNWEVNGKSGVKAYVKSMYVTIAEDQFEKKYHFDDEPVPFD